MALAFWQPESQLVVVTLDDVDVLMSHMLDVSGTNVAIDHKLDQPDHILSHPDIAHTRAQLVFGISTDILGLLDTTGIQIFAYLPGLPLQLPCRSPQLKILSGRKPSTWLVTNTHTRKFRHRLNQAVFAGVAQHFANQQQIRTHGDRADPQTAQVGDILLQSDVVDLLNGQVSKEWQH